MKTYINIEDNSKVLVKMVKYGCIKTYGIYEKGTFNLIRIVDNDTFKKNFKRAI